MWPLSFFCNCPLAISPATMLSNSCLIHYSLQHLPTLISHYYILLSTSKLASIVILNSNWTSFHCEDLETPFNECIICNLKVYYFFNSLPKFYVCVLIPVIPLFLHKGPRGFPPVLYKFHLQFSWESSPLSLRELTILRRITELPFIF